MTSLGRKWQDAPKRRRLVVMITAARSLEREEKQQLINLHELTYLEFWNEWRHGKRISYYCAFPRLGFLHDITASAPLLPSTPAWMSDLEA